MRERVAPRFIQSYFPECLLARGEGATVWLARSKADGRPVALKVGDGAEGCPVQAVERLTTEVLACGRVSHPNVVRVLDQGLADAVPWIAREYLPGPLLGDVVPVGGLPWQVAAGIAAQLAAALAAVHAAGLYHRDVKAGNVLRAADGSWKLTDFDVACDMAHADEVDATFAGTPGYVAPEVVRGRPASVQSEVYALGAVLYLLLTGHLPHGGGDAMELMHRCLEEEPVAPSAHGANVPEALDRLVLAALALDPKRRPASMDVFASRLADMLSSKLQCEPSRKLSASLSMGGAGAWGAPRTSPGRKTGVKRAVPAAAVAARATKTARALPPQGFRVRMPRAVVTIMVFLVVVGCGLLASSGVLISETPASAPFRAFREAAAKTMAMAAGIGMPGQLLKIGF